MFIAFGSIERTTHQCIHDWAGKTIHKHFARAPLSSRIDLARDLAKSQDAPKVTQEAFIHSLLTAKKLAESRNLVAHNPLCLVILQGAPDNPLLEAIAHHTDDSKLLSYEALVEIVERTELCAEDLVHNFVAFRLAKLDLGKYGVTNKTGFKD
ncbi:hypothetical protein FIV41_13700 [Pseudomonas marginalis]|uniref:Uncharacterized protein n=1 Tax=Pseudomonas marginalis TaxID=298 RepID=A0A9X9FXR5_PSEMA|nr:hypothetical protein [Pseudomonas marginalis]TWR59802.1 hypothetical protein FIV41_13700 [Pseudomonas marginalis]